MASTMVSCYILTLTALLLLCCIKAIHADAATYTMIVNDRVITGANGVLGGLNVGSQVQVACRYQSGIADPDVYKIDASDGSEHLLNSNVQTSFTSSYTLRTYTLTNADKQGTATYRCIDKNKAGCPDYSQVTIGFTARTPSPGPILWSDCHPGGANDRPSVNPSTATYTMFVNNGEITGANGVLGGLDSGSSVHVACRYLRGINEPNVYKIYTSENLLNSYVQRKSSGDYEWRTYILTDADKQGTATYRCIDKNKNGCPDYSQVTISFTARTPSPGPILRSDCRPGGANNRPSVSPSNIHSTAASSSDGTAAGQRFAGFNPLIYIISVAAVVVLGTLVIIAIVTCWIQARRSYNRRMFQSSANPQDHLNYITDNEYTPLTTSEFLQERSPTFHVGEEIQGQMRPEVGDDDMETSNSSSSSDVKSSSI